MDLRYFEIRVLNGLTSFAANKHDFELHKHKSKKSGLQGDSYLYLRHEIWHPL